MVRRRLDRFAQLINYVRIECEYFNQSLVDGNRFLGSFKSATIRVTDEALPPIHLAAHFIQMHKLN